MTDLTARLDAIQARAETSADAGNFVQRALTESDLINVQIPFLLDLARKQQAQLEAVGDLARSLEYLAPGDRDYVGLHAHHAGLIRAALEARHHHEREAATMVVRVPVDQEPWPPAIIPPHETIATMLEWHSQGCEWPVSGDAVTLAVHRGFLPKSAEPKP
jgi:hypothetical protein